MEKLGSVCCYATEQCNHNSWLKHNERYNGSLTQKKKCTVIQKVHFQSWKITPNSVSLKKTKKLLWATLNKSSDENLHHSHPTLQQSDQSADSYR